jgi:hypothetical protein
MAPAPVPGSSSTTATPQAAGLNYWGWLVVALPQVAALVLMVDSESDAVSHAAFLLTWGILNFFWLLILRRPALSGMLSLAMIFTLVLLSRLKYDVVQMTVNFVDVMVIDPDSFAYLLTVFPSLRWSIGLGAVVSVPLIFVLWRLDPFRVRRLSAAVAGVTCLAALSAIATAWPSDPWHGFQNDGYVSKFARSGVNAVSDFSTSGFMESDTAVTERLRMPLEDSCAPAARRPHIIMIHDESSFDIRSAPGVKVPPKYGSHFLSSDGKARKFLVEGSGGPSWYTEYNVLAGLSSRSFGRFSYFVTRIAAGRVDRGLPMALKRCGYNTVSLYPAYGAFMSARSFQTTMGVDHFYDARDLGAKGIEPDSFFYDSALKMFAQEPAGNKPTFMFVYLAANHFPWEKAYRPDLVPDFKMPGNAPKVDEYLRRQTMSERDYREFRAKLARQFPNQPFLIIRYGDHQPEFSSTLLDPVLDDEGVSKKMMSYDRRYFETYYAIDAVNYKPVASPTTMDTIDAAYLPIVVQETAGLPLDPSFEEQKKIMLRCKGLFYACKDGAEARRFNRLLIDAGFVKNL